MSTREIVQDIGQRQDDIVGLLRELVEHESGTYDKSDVDTLGALLRERLESLEGERGRVMELEERIDFAERLLARGRATPELEREHS